MVQPIQTWFDDILVSIQKWLITTLQFEPDQVLLRMEEQSWEDESPPGADQYLILLLGRFDTNQPMVIGGGRYTPYLSRKLTILIRSRSLVDSSLDQKEHLLGLTDITLGHLELERRVLDALLVFAPEDEVGNWLVTWPIEIRGASSPEKGRTNKEWATTTFETNLPMQARVDQTRQ